MQKMDVKLRKVEDRLKALDAKLDVLVAETKKAGVDAKVDIHKRIDVVKAKREAAKHKIDEIKATGNDKWVHLKSGLGVAWKDLEKTFKELVH